MMRFQRRQRTTFSKHQLDALQAAFKQNHYPEAHFRDYLAKTTNLDPSRIQVWFQNQRAKDRKRRGIMGEPPELMSPASASQTNLTRDSYSPASYPKQARPPNNNDYMTANENTFYTSRVDSYSRMTPTTRLVDFDEETLRRRCGTGRPTHICVFSSDTANEAAEAVSAGKFLNIVDYHHNKYSIQKRFLSSNSESTFTSSSCSIASPQSLEQQLASPQPHHQLASTIKRSSNVANQESGSFKRYRHLESQLDGVQHVQSPWSTNWLKNLS